MLIILNRFSMIIKLVLSGVLVLGKQLQVGRNHLLQLVGVVCSGPSLVRQLVYLVLFFFSLNILHIGKHLPFSQIR
jgi:hypothetical protein